MSQQKSRRWTLSDYRRTAVIWPEYCRYGGKHKTINQSLGKEIPNDKTWRLWAKPPELFFFRFCLGFYVRLENFSLIWRRHHYWRRAAKFDLCSTLMAIEQWGFFSGSHLLWHGASVYNGHLRGPVTLTLLAEGLVVELSIPVFTT